MNQHLSKRKALKEAIPYLERFGLGEYSNKPPYAMSGGMRQRASFVRTILTGKDILLFDEPFGAGAADVFLETERKVFRMSGPEERERAVGLYFTTPMTTAQVGEAPGLSDQAVPGTPVGEGSPVCRSYGGTHHPAGDKGQGDRTGCFASIFLKQFLHYFSAVWAAGFQQELHHMTAQTRTGTGPPCLYIPET